LCPPLPNGHEICFCFYFCGGAMQYWFRPCGAAVGVVVEVMVMAIVPVPAAAAVADKASSIPGISSSIP